MTGDEKGSDSGREIRSMDHKIKILIVEDSPNINLMYDRGLPGAVFEKRFATNGQDGLSLFKEWGPEIMILDVMLPLLSGYTLLKIIRRQIKDDATAVIISTSLSGKDDVAALVQLGIQGYIVKPFVMKKIGGQILQYFAGINPARAQNALFVYNGVIENLIQSSTGTKISGREDEDEKMMHCLPDFTEEEFTGSMTVEDFFRVFEKDRYNVTFSSEKNTLARMNELLQLPNLYEMILEKKTSIKIPPGLNKLLTDWQPYRNADYVRLTVTSKRRIRIANRLLLQALYPDLLPPMKSAST